MISGIVNEQKGFWFRDSVISLKRCCRRRGGSTPSAAVNAIQAGLRWQLALGGKVAVG